ncbi:MAG: hypothetical protein V1836_02915 [Candidatus Aenigmatarchaeota archaeon]
MASKELPKKIIITILSILFLVSAPIAVNAFILQNIGAKNVVGGMVGSIASGAFDKALQDACGKQTAMAYGDCEKLVLGSACTQYADADSCVNVGSKGKDYFVQNILLPSTLPLVYNYTIPSINMKVSELDAAISNVFVASFALTMVAVILMLMLVADPKGILKLLGVNIFWVGLSMALLVFGTNAILPSLLNQQVSGIDAATMQMVANAIGAGIKPFMDAEMTIGVVLIVLGLASIASSYVFFKSKSDR